MGITVLKSGEQRTVFSKEGAEKELGTNIAAIVYFPEFMALGDLTTNVLLAYVPDVKNPGFCYVVYGGAKVERDSLVEIGKEIENLKNLLKEVGPPVAPRSRKTE